MSAVTEVVPKIARLLPEEYQFTGYCSDYLGCWVFPYLRIPFDYGASGYLFVNKNDLKCRALHPDFDLEDYLAAPVVLEPDEFEKYLPVNFSEKGTNFGKKRVRALMG